MAKSVPSRAACTICGAQGRTPVLVCSPQLRLPLRRLVKVVVARLPVLSYAEIATCTARIETMGVVTGAHAIAA